MTPRRHSPVNIETTDAHFCTNMTRLSILGKLPFFQSLSEIELQQINDMFYQKDYAAGDIVYFSGDPAENLLVIAEGRIKTLHHTLTGKEVLLDLLTPGEFFGALSGYGRDAQSETAQAILPSCILVIDRDNFQQVIQHHPGVGIKVIDIMAKKLHAANERVHLLSALPVEGRIANILLKLGEKFGEQTEYGLLLQVPLTREDLAGMTATTAESASRVVSQFNKSGLIRSGRGWIALVDIQSLEIIAGKEIS